MFDMTPVREEVFGPFVVIQSFKDQKDAVDKANDTEYGLGCLYPPNGIAKWESCELLIYRGVSILITIISASTSSEGGSWSVSFSLSWGLRPVLTLF
jgi:hypothetical protein